MRGEEAPTGHRRWSGIGSAHQADAPFASSLAFGPPSTAECGRPTTGTPVAPCTSSWPGAILPSDVLLMPKEKINQGNARTLNLGVARPIGPFPVCSNKVQP